MDIFHGDPKIITERGLNLDDFEIHIRTFGKMNWPHFPF